MNNNEEASQLNDLVRNLVKSNFEELAREQRVLIQKVAIVADGGADGANVTVYFPPDLTTKSNFFKNKTL